MSEVERGILRQFAVELKRDVIPSEVLPYLLCLTEDDCEQIQREEDRKGPRAAVATLLDRVKKRLKQGAFKEFSSALGKTGCSHLQESLENALDKACQPKPEHNNPTQNTSKSQSSSLKTPTTETANSLSPSTPENKQFKKPTKSGKKLKLKNGQVPKENTTSPPESKTQTKVKTADSSNSQPTDTTDANPPYVKLVKAPRNTRSKKSGVTQKVPKCPPETTNNEDSKKKISSNNNTDTQPPPPIDPEETDLTGNSTTLYDTLVCYAEEDCQIALELKQFLETECGLQVCIDFQNFMPGKPTTDNITESINSSGSIIFLLSSKFLQKLWAQYELKHAVYNFNESRQDGKHKKIIPVLLEKCQVPDDLKIYTAIKMEGPGSRKECWKKLAAAVSGTSYSNDNDTSCGNGCSDDEDDDHGDHNAEDKGNSEENDRETSNDDGANDEGTTGVSDNHSSDNDDDNSGDEDVNDNDLDEDGEDTVHGSNEAESNDGGSSSDNDDGSSSDNDDGSDGDKDGSENSSHDSDNDDNHNCGGDDVAGNNSNDAGDIVGGSHANCENEVSDDVEGGNSAEVDTNNVVVHGNASGDSAEVDTNNVVVHGNASGDSASVNNADRRSKDGYGSGKIDSL